MYRLSPRCLLAAMRGVTLLCLASSLSGLMGQGSPSAAADSPRLSFLQEQYHARHATFAREMGELADECAGGGFADDAARIRLLSAPLETQTLNVDDLPEEVESDQFAGFPPAERDWRVRLRKVRRDYAADLYLLSRRALNSGYPSFAFHLVREVAFQDADHVNARRLLGYVRHQDGWTTPFVRDRLRNGFVWHERFGWLPGNHIAKYDAGQRYYRGRWVTAEKEASLRRNFDNAWEVETEHFLIRTNHSLERGVELGVGLEEFHRFFMRTFAAFFNTPQQMQRLFDGGATGSHLTAQRRHVVHYYLTRDEFIHRLEKDQPNIAISNGLYLPSTRTAHLFFDPDNAEANAETMFHEVTHQLLGESARQLVDVGRDANFWLIEGIACYMESYRFDGGRSTVGDPRHVRIHWARVRAVEEDFYVPLAQISALGMRGFQSLGDQQTLQKYYSQAAGLTHFFLHGRDGEYRDALIEHLALIYSPNERIRSSVPSLADLTGVPNAELDRQYRDYMRDLAGRSEAVAPISLKPESAVP